MNPLPFTTFLARYLRYPEFRDFLNEGYGIAARAKRCLTFWERHLEYSREFERRCLGGFSGGRLLVFGAGRLLDFDLQFLEKRFSEIVFYDADPGVLSTWRKARRHAAKRGCKISFELVDLTGQLVAWKSALRAELKSGGRCSNLSEKIVEFLAGLVQTAAPKLALPSCEAVISLNILSQIPISWREFAEKLIRKKLRVGPQASLPKAVEAALNATCAALQRQHLELVKSCSANVSVLIGDIYFHYYKQDTALWQTEEALYDKALLQDADISDAWLWHIAPQGIESNEYGVIHEVLARAWRARTV